jgi:CheY-like chemotaxis protein
VKDTGIGIDNEIGDRVFDRFYHYESSGATEYEGFGLGLSICHGLVKLLNGNIWYNSEVGKGTTFYFSIPYIQAQAIEDVHSEEITKNEYSKPRKILIADDNYISYKYLYEVLNNDHTTILYAKNGEQAVEIVKSTDDIDIVLMDMRMPVMDGKSATEIIKKIRPKLPVIANTAYAFSNESDIMQNLGFNDYISKPVEKIELFNLIEKHLKV